MTDNGDLEARVAGLEKENAVTRADVTTARSDVATAKTDAAIARTLAACADRDVSEVRDQLRAHIHVLNALRLTQLEHGTKIEGLNDRMDALREEVRTGFAEFRAEMAEMRTGFTTSMAHLVTLLEGPTSAES